MAEWRECGRVEGDAGVEIADMQPKMIVHDDLHVMRAILRAMVIS
jgi:hypothetical protein